MRGPRIRLSLSPTTPSLPPLSSLLVQFTKPPSPLLQPLSPLRPLKSPASILPPPSALDSPHRSKHPFSPTPTSPLLYPAAQPPRPLAWTWRCHLCRTTYRLGTTRRCLLDGHYFCSNPPPPSPSPPSPSPASFTAATARPAPLPLTEHHGHAAGSERGRSKRSSSRRANRDPESCTSSFDYLGWADWNAWRRNLSPPAAAGLLRSRNAAPGLAQKCRKDCSRDCDFPSECCWQWTAAYLESVLEAQADRSPVGPF